MVPGLSFINKPEITIGATYFELGFFQKASEYSFEFKLPLKDAIHLIYVSHEEVDIIVASCGHFQRASNQIKNKFGIEVCSPEQVLSQL